MTGAPPVPIQSVGANQVQHHYGENINYRLNYARRSLGSPAHYVHGGPWPMGPTEIMCGTAVLYVPASQERIIGE
jgi:hypothetical protein